MILKRHGIDLCVGNTMAANPSPQEDRYVDVRFRGQTYRVTVDHAHMLAARGHLRRYHFGGVKYEVEDDRYIHVRGEPVCSGHNG